MRRFLYDTNVFVYASGAEHPYREPCRAIVARAIDGELVGEASVDLVQEYLHHRLRQIGDRAVATRDARDVAAICRLHDLARADVARALTLFAQHPQLAARDASFAAVALNHQIDAILSADRDFDGIEELQRIDPADAVAVDALAR